MTTTDLPPPTDRDRIEPDGFDPPDVDPADDEIVVLETVDSPALEDVPPEDVPPEDDLGGDAADELSISDMDPRMRERWIVARREEGRRRLRVLVGVIGAASLLGIAFLVAHSPLLGADTVEVRGATLTGPAAVRAAARIGDGAPLLFLDEATIARRVEAIPEVDRAKVTTSLPNTVVISVTERQPVAWVRTSGSMPFATVDGDGRILRLSAAPPPLLAEVVRRGAPNAAPVGTPGRRVAEPTPFRGLRALPSALRLQVRSVAPRGREWIMTIGGDPPIVGEIRFGPMTDMARKSESALAVIEELGRRGRRAASLDVSVPGSPITR